MSQGSDDKTTFLFARPSFIEGIARVFDFGNVLNQYNRSATEEEADHTALRMDLEAIAADFWKAIGMYEECRRHGTQ